MEIPHIDPDCEYCTRREATVRSLPRLGELFAQRGLSWLAVEIAQIIEEAPSLVEDGHFYDCPIVHTDLLVILVYPPSFRTARLAELIRQGAHRRLGPILDPIRMDSTDTLARLIKSGFYLKRTGPIGITRETDPPSSE